MLTGPLYWLVIVCPWPSWKSCEHWSYWPQSEVCYETVDHSHFGIAGTVEKRFGNMLLHRTNYQVEQRVHCPVRLSRTPTAQMQLVWEVEPAGALLPCGHFMHSSESWFSAKEFSGHFSHLAPEPFLGHVAVKSDVVWCELQVGKGANCDRDVCDFWITSKSKTTSSCSICL